MAVHRRLSKKGWLNIPIGAWAAMLLIFIVAAAVLGTILIRRDIAEYRVEKHFSVRDPSFFGSALSLGDPIPIEGNKIQLLHNGQEIFPALLAAIRSGQKTINFEAFLFETGRVGAEFRDALIERAKAGVIVRVLLDGIGSGSKLKNEDVALMTQAGCRFAYYHPTHSWRIDQLNRRTHRRVLVVDGKVGFTGGVGFADRWDGNADSPEQWRDVHARLEGPIVTRLQAAFQSHWIKCTGENLTGANEFPLLPAAGSLKAQVVVSQSFSYAPLAFVQAVAFTSAEKSIDITNAYCAPSQAQVDMLVAAVKRGVRVRLLLPGKHNDQPISKAAGRTAYGDLLKGGVQIFEYTPTMIHTKTMVVDEMVSVFGSSNFDARSSQINEELDVVVYDEGFGREMEATFKRDLEHCKPYRLEDFERRSLWERISEWAALPFHSQV